MKKHEPEPGDNDRKVQAYSNAMTHFLKVIKPLENNTEYAAVAATLIQIRAARNYIEGRKKQILQPVRQLGDVVKEWFSAPEATLQEAETKIKAVMEMYADQAVPKASQAASEALLRGDIQGMQLAMTAVPPVNGISLSTVQDFEVVDEQAVPEQFLKIEINTAKVRAEGRAGRSVPGIRFFERTRVSVSNE